MRQNSWTLPMLFISKDKNKLLNKITKLTILTYFRGIFNLDCFRVAFLLLLANVPSASSSVTSSASLVVALDCISTLKLQK